MIHSATNCPLLIAAFPKTPCPAEESNKMFNKTGKVILSIVIVRSTVIRKTFRINMTIIKNYILNKNSWLELISVDVLPLQSYLHFSHIQL